MSWIDESKNGAVGNDDGMAMEQADGVSKTRVIGNETIEL